MKLGRVIPVFGGLAQLVSDIGIAAEQAAYNKIAAKHLNSRVEELTVVLRDMFKEITPEKFIPSLKLEVERLEPCLEKALKFVEKFKKKGYLRKLLMGDSIKEKIQALDKEITDCVQSIGLSLQLTSIKMHNQMYDQLDEVAALVAQSTENNTKPLDPADPAVQQIADKMGIEVMELTEELKVINRKLDDLSGDIASMKGDIDDKLNRLLAAAEAAAFALSVEARRSRFLRPCPTRAGRQTQSHAPLSTVQPKKLLQPPPRQSKEQGSATSQLPSQSSPQQPPYT